MADEFLTEDQEAERAKTWVRENGLFVVAGVVLGLGGLFGWQAWNDYRTGQAEQAAAVWQQMRSALDGQRFNEVDETYAILESEYAGTPYMDQGRLAMAALHMSRNDSEAALAELGQLASAGNDPQLRRIAEFREAQILNSLERYDDALLKLGDAETSGLAAMYHELRGDALFGKGDYESASDAYNDALNNDTGGVIDRSYVQMKLDQALGAVSAAAVAAAPETAAAEAAADAVQE